MSVLTPSLAANAQLTDRRAVSTGAIAAALLALFAVDNIVLLAFLGVPSVVVVGLAVSGAAMLWHYGRSTFQRMPNTSAFTLITALGVAFVLLVLGGEGRFFYANADWQIRDAVLADMAMHAWPFGYAVNDQAFVLRAPIGMYLLPSLTGAGQGAELALLASNTLRLGLCLALAAPLFPNARARGIALGCFILFSGWDAVGTLLYAALGIPPAWDHLEPWNFGFQYSSHLTQLFWVPQHAIAGWLAAVTFLLWRSGKAPLAVFSAALPLIAIWSPLAVIGSVPFALFAGITVLRERSFTHKDVLLTACALIMSMVPLLYMQVDAREVGGGITSALPSVIAFCFMLEVFPLIYPLLRQPKSSSTDRAVLWLVLGVLIVLPLLQIGKSADLQMRGSIPALAILAIAFATWMNTLLAERTGRGAAIGAGIIIAIGAMTPAMELRRPFINETSPRPLCSLVDVWQQQTGLRVPISTYLARTASLPQPLSNIPVVVSAGARSQCWDKPWTGARQWNASDQAAD